MAQGVNPTPSSSHWKVAVNAGVAANEKLALVLVVDAAGDEVIVVSGGADGLIVQAKDAGVGSVPFASVARTWNVWLPSAGGAYVTGLAHAENAAPSSAHWNFPPADVLMRIGDNRTAGEAVARAVGFDHLDADVLSKEIFGVSSLPAG